jgi:hypothetical protein
MLAYLLRWRLRNAGVDPSPSPKPLDFPFVCKETQCIFCLGNELLLYVWTPSYYYRNAMLVATRHGINLKMILSWNP